MLRPAARYEPLMRGTLLPPAFLLNQSYGIRYTWQLRDRFVL